MVEKQGLFYNYILSICFFAPVAGVLGAADFFSENTGALYIKQASEIHDEDPLDEMRTKQSAAFLESAGTLAPMSANVPQQMLEVFTANCFNPLYEQKDLTWAMGEYLKERRDVQLATKAVGCMLEQLNRRIDREVLLQQLTRKYASHNPVFASDLATQGAFLAMERSDMSAAKNLFSRAFQLNRYNTLAFSQAIELTKTQELSLDPALEPLMYRIRLTVNPYDLDAAAAYADSLHRLQIYDVAARAYEYTAQLYGLLYPGSPVSREIVQSWMLSCYHDKHSQIKLLEIAEQYRDPQQFDLLLESLAGKTLLKLGQIEKAKRALSAAAEKAESLLLVKQSPQQVYPEYLAWFHSFVLEDTDAALAWGNQAFVEDPNRQGVQSIFAYVLAKNEQYELAKRYAEPFQKTDQIAALTMALVQLSEEKEALGTGSLKTTVEMAPETLTAEKALDVLHEQDSEYIPSVRPETILDQLQQEYALLVPDFEPLSSRYTARLLFNGSDFLYGADFPARVVINNISSEPLVISDKGLLNGELRVDVELQGDLKVSIPDLYTMKFRPEKPILPSEHLSIPLDLNRGQLRKILLTYPQADVTVVFTVHMGSLVSSGGQSNVFTIESQIRRRKVIMSDSFLMQRLDVLRKGQVGQKYQASSLFTGLLAEQNAIRNSQADFPHHRVESVLLEDAVRSILADSDWKVRVHAMDSLLTLSIPLSHQMLLDVSANLNHEKWPVRLSALYLLATSPSDSFQQVLDWAAEHDPDSHVRQMAISLGGQGRSAESSAPPSDLTE